MANDEKTVQISADTDGEKPAPAAPGRIDPAALTVAQLARLLGLAERKVHEHLAAGAPAGADETVNLVHYTAWLNRRLKDRDGD